MKNLEQARMMVNGAINVIKTATGIGNNAAWMACLDSWDHIKHHPDIRRSLKGGSTPLAEFRRCFRTLHDYEKKLLWSNNNPYFRVSEMSDRLRKVYGDISDRDYYDLWTASGFNAYMATKPFFTSLVNKFRIANVSHGVKEAEILAWANASGCALDIAVDIYNQALRISLSEMLGINTKALSTAFRDFCIAPVNIMWQNAVRSLDADDAIKPDDTEKKNIQAGVNQLAAEWMKADTIYGSQIKAADDYAELFRTKGEMKKAQRIFSQMRDEVNADIAKDRRKPQKGS